MNNNRKSKKMRLPEGTGIITNKNRNDRTFLFLIYVALKGIEPLSKVPETFILSIELQRLGCKVRNFRGANHSECVSLQVI